jgi:hypothetical protein
LLKSVRLLQYILLIERYIYDAGSPVVFHYSVLEILNGTAWEVMDLPIGYESTTMVQLPCPVN